jgi:hypothetical protein
MEIATTKKDGRLGKGLMKLTVHKISKHLAAMTYTEFFLPLAFS